jgi:DNA-binding MarR family transcriptional regulator
MRDEALQRIFSITLRVRILRAWQAANQARDQAFSERELLAMELINDYPPITEKSLTKIFGLSFSSVADILKKLREMEVIEPPEKGRGKPLALTKQGKERLESLKTISSARYAYLFESVTDKEWDFLLAIFKKMEDSVENHIQRLVFGGQPSE